MTGEWQFQAGQWQPIDFPENLPERNGQQLVWLKIDLPHGNWRDPYLFISSIDLSAEVFHNQQKIYQFGDIDAHGHTRFQGWPWHAFRLPDNYADHSLYFRVASDYTSLGLAGQVAIGNQFNLLDKVYRSGMTGLIFIIIMLLVGIISTVMGIIKKDRHVAFATGLLSFNLALMMFSENELSQVILFEPLLWRYIAAFSYFLVPALLAVIILAWLKHNPPKAAWIVLVITLSFVLGVALLNGLGDFNFVNAYPYFDVLFIILVFALLSGCIRQFYQEGITGNLMIFGIVALFFALLLDMLSAHAFIPWIGRAGQWGLVFFSLAALMIYFVRDWKQQLALATLTQELESQVRVRTSQLEQSQLELEKLAREDYLTKLLNRRAFTELALNEIANALRHHRPVSLLLFDLDHFKEVNDHFGHSMGDLVLKEVARVSKDICRHGELICRYGGEEFVILLHATEAVQATQLANRLHRAIKEIEVQTNGHQIKITASFGLISIDCNDPSQAQPEDIVDKLLSAADKMMYEVKIAGRDGVKTLELRVAEL
jgi:diguanylate cyclase (GGDEF)-like protein